MTALARYSVPVLLLSWTLTAQPVAATVSDSAGFFSADAVKKANERIKDVAAKTKKTLVVETFKEVPEDRKKELDQLGKEEFFRRWARERAKQLDENGVYLLLCKSPGRVEFMIGTDTQKRAFTTSDMRALLKTIKPHLDEKTVEGNDKALAEVVERVTGAYLDHEKPAANKPFARPERQGNGIGGWICLGLCVLLGVWLLVGLMRGLSGGGGYGGGGFFSTFLAGMFGAAAGMWMYNSFFGGSDGLGGSSAAGADGYGTDTDYSGGGTDFGDGGGDFGGGGADF